jgi:uracil-DNA glycosylase
LKALIKEIEGCKVCAEALAHGPRPIISVHQKSSILIIGQAPGSVVHKTGVPWDDKSGENLRKWMEIENATFYDPK